MRAQRRYEVLLCVAVLALFGAYWGLSVTTSGTPRFENRHLLTAVEAAVFGTLWVVAVRLLWRAWVAHSAYLGGALAPADGPALLLALAAGALPEHRRDWGAALVAELSQVRGRGARWRFAAGGARVALFPPRARRVPLLALGAGVALAVLGSGLGVGQALPALQPFAVTFVALAGGGAILASARPGQALWPRSRAAVALAGIAGVGACVALTVCVLATSAAPAQALRPREALLLAFILAACLGLALTPPRALTSSRLAQRLGAGTAFLLGLGFLPASRATIHTEAGVMVYLFFAPPLLCFAVGMAAAVASGRSFRAGVQAALWAVVIGALATFVLWMPEALYRYGVDAGQLLDGEGGLPFDNNLHYAIWWCLLWLPVWGLPFGVFGAAAGARRQEGARPGAPG